jgi:hypothetical protein
MISFLLYLIFNIEFLKLFVTSLSFKVFQKNGSILTKKNSSIAQTNDQTSIVLIEN